MAQVAEETETFLEPRQRFAGLAKTIPEAISVSAISLARDLHVKAFLIPTTSGSTARLIARYRPTQPIIAVSRRSSNRQNALFGLGRLSAIGARL